MTTSAYAIAAGANQPLNNLVNIETITATGDTRKFAAPQAIAFGQPGTGVVRLDGQGFRRGYPSLDWLFSAMTRLQYDYARATWTLTDGYSGPVTIYSTLGGLTYARYNAILFIPAMAETPDSRFFASKQLPFHFRKLVAL